MFEASYGQFADAVEEFNFPSNGNENNQDVQLDEKNSRSFARVAKKTISQQDLVERFFSALEQASVQQVHNVQSSGGLSAATSGASLASCASEADINHAREVFQAMQTLVVGSTSTDSLNGLNSSSSASVEASLNRMQLPAVFQQFVTMFDEFMHNPSQDNVPVEA